MLLVALLTDVPDGRVVDVDDEDDRGDGVNTLPASASVGAVDAALVAGEDEAEKQRINTRQANSGGWWVGKWSGRKAAVGGERREDVRDVFR